MESRRNGPQLSSRHDDDDDDDAVSVDLIFLLTHGTFTLTRVRGRVRVYRL